MAKQELVLGGGCFWCLEAVFELLEGVEDVVSGYANGTMADPDYRAVCSGDTGHAEVVRITYDDQIITADDLLEVFFEIHDPTTLNRQGADRGTQYRSVILYETEEIKEKALKAREKAQEKYSAPIVTIIEPLDRFYMAESYHQDYYRHNANQGYCMAVISPKVAKLKEKFSKKVKQ
ncbi:MAG TPA: peptide-methionine (S)-S-oxide reductase [Epsilonproteobacteria bacterium]|nr:peptide-methionine (S)-S-oxide reductase [Campylobacterota bacterium]